MISRQFMLELHSENSNIKGQVLQSNRIMSPQVLLALCLVLFAVTVAVPDQNVFLERYVVFPLFVL